MKGSVHEDDSFIFHDALVLMTPKETIEWMKNNKYLYRWLLPMNGFQDRTPYYGRPVYNIPEFMPLDNRTNIEIFHSLCFHCVLIHFVLYGEVTDKEEMIMRFSFFTPKETAIGLNRIQESKMGTPSSARIIKDADLALKVL